MTRPFLLLGDSLFLTTQLLLPKKDVCDISAGTGWMMMLGAKNGAAFLRPKIDLDGSGKLSGGDYVEFTKDSGEKFSAVPAGMESLYGMPTDISVYSASGGKLVWRKNSTQSGQVNNKLNLVLANPARLPRGLALSLGGVNGQAERHDLLSESGGYRLGWRELF